MEYEYKVDYNKDNHIKLPKKSDQNNKNNNIKLDLKNYIGQLNDNTLLKNLLVIQSHNSGTNDQIYAGKGKIFKWISRLLGNIPGKLANCQTVSLIDQFNSGVRAFDIRVTEFEGNWYFEHGPTISKNPVNEEIGALVQTVKNNPKELVFIFIRSDNESSMLNSAWYQSLKQHCFEPDGEKLQQHSIKEVCDTKKNIILVSSNGYNPDPKTIWDQSEFEECWDGTACGSDDRDLKINYFKNVIENNSDTNFMYGIKIPNTTEDTKLKKFFKFFQNKTSIFPLKDARNVTYTDTEEILDWVDTNKKRLNFIAVDGVGSKNVDDAIRLVGEFNLKRNMDLFN